MISEALLLHDFSELIWTFYVGVWKKISCPDPFCR